MPGPGSGLRVSGARYRCFCPPHQPPVRIQRQLTNHMGVEATIEQNSAQDKAVLGLDETVGFECVRVNDPAWDLGVIPSIDMTTLDQIFNECASGALAAGRRN